MNQNSAAAINDQVQALGVMSTAPLQVDGNTYHSQFSPERAMAVDWTTKGLTVTRLRLLSDPGYPNWDVSYCHGKLADGTLVNVQLPFDQIPKSNVTGFIIERARIDKVFAKGLGILSSISMLN